MVSEMSPRIETHVSLEGFFEELLRDAMAVERVQLEHASLAYVTRLFADFSTHSGLHGRQDGDDRGTPALVWLFEQAQTATDPGKRFDAFRHLGDVSLVVSGFFTPHVERDRSLVGVDYYVQMGTSAYGAAAGLAKKTGFSRLLSELAQKFSQLVEVMSRVAERTTLPVASDLKALYARMIRNPNSLAVCEQLLERGVAPVFVNTTVKA